MEATTYHCSTCDHDYPSFAAVPPKECPACRDGLVRRPEVNRPAVMRGHDIGCAIADGLRCDCGRRPA
jgi:DNA-directed RNA polymerase subunit RPC12/RpoP